MRAGLKYRWLDMANKKALEAHWDPDLFFPVDIEDNEFKIEVRKSPLSFAVRESPLNHDQYVVSCGEHPPRTPAEGGTPLHATEVDERLKDWLLHAVTEYVSGHDPAD